ncbi:DUF550 domain-containing protein [Salmonella enterica]|nr:DUF550 domain-containing protein [Salmonella enterica]
MNNKLTDERVSNATLLRLIQWADQHNSHYVAAALCELQERRKADNQEPAPERERIRREHAEWSDKTFGDVGPIGPLKHLSKEALEAAADPSDPLEWADMQFLLWDAQRRTGITDEQITQAMIEKLAINKVRQWPEPKDGEPRLHIKAQPAPVVPEDISGIIERFQYQADHLSDWHHIDEHSCKVNRRDLMTALEFMDSCRAAMLQGKFRDLSQPVDPQVAAYEQIMLQAGWVMVPVEPTDEMIVAAMDSDDVSYNESDDTVFYVHHREIYKAMLAAAPQPEANNE